MLDPLIYLDPSLCHVIDTRKTSLSTKDCGLAPEAFFWITMSKCPTTPLTVHMHECACVHVCVHAERGLLMR